MRIRRVRWPASRAGVVGAIVAVGLLLTMASHARAYVYWANRGNGAGTTLGRANLDGTGIDENFVEGAKGPVGIAVDASHIYWANTFASPGTIGRSNLDGTEASQSFISGASSPCGVAVNSEYVYWGNHGTGTIGRARLNGSEINESFISGADAPCGVTVDASHVYWANENGTTIGRANLDGSEPDESFVTVAKEPVGVTVNGSFIYWGNNGSGTIGRATLNGTEQNNSFIVGLGSCTDFPAVDATDIYWANDCASSIGRAQLGGSGVEESFIGVPANPGGVAVDQLPGSQPVTPVKSATPVDASGNARFSLQLERAKALPGKGVKATLACSGPSRQNCQATETLASTETLTSKKTAARLLARFSKRQTRRRVVIVGGKTTMIPAGQTVSLLLGLNSTGHGLLKRFGKVPVTLTIGLTAEGHTATVASRKLTIRAKHKRKARPGQAH
jgi:streptogramin lyase